MKKDIAVKMAIARLLSILPSIILNFMAVIPIRKEVVGREKLQAYSWPHESFKISNQFLQKKTG